MIDLIYKQQRAELAAPQGGPPTTTKATIAPGMWLEVTKTVFAASEPQKYVDKTQITAVAIVQYCQTSDQASDSPWTMLDHDPDTTLQGQISHDTMIKLSTGSKDAPVKEKLDSASAYGDMMMIPVGVSVLHHQQALAGYAEVGSWIGDTHLLPLEETNCKSIGVTVVTYPVLMLMVKVNSSKENADLLYTHAIGNIATDVPTMIAVGDHDPGDDPKLADPQNYWATSPMMYCWENSGELTCYTHKVSCCTTEETFDMETAPFAYCNLSACKAAEEESVGADCTYSTDFTEHEFPVNSTSSSSSASIDLGGTQEEVLLSGKFASASCNMMEWLEVAEVGMACSTGMNKDAAHVEMKCSSIDQVVHDVTSNVANFHGDGKVLQCTAQVTSYDPVGEEGSFDDPSWLRPLAVTSRTAPSHNARPLRNPHRPL